MRLRWLLPLLVLLAACAAPPESADRADAPSIVFGYFDLTAAPSDLDWVSLRRSDGRRYLIPATDGFFFYVGVETGAYRVDQFGGTSGNPPLRRRPVEYGFDAKARNPTEVRIVRPGVYFLGAYEFTAPSGELRPVPVPDERQLLQRVIRELETDKDLRRDPRPLRLARARLAEL